MHNNRNIFPLDSRWTRPGTNATSIFLIVSCRTTMITMNMEQKQKSIQRLAHLITVRPFDVALASNLRLTQRKYYVAQRTGLSKQQFYECSIR